MNAAIPSLETLAEHRVLVAGDVMLDRYWFGEVERISPEAPVPVVRVGREEERLGGAANVAYNVHALGTRATLVTVAGDDAAADRIEQLLGAQGVEHRLARDAELQTIVKLRVIGRSQQLIRLDFENAPGHAVLAGLYARFEAELPRHDAVLLSDYAKGALEHAPQMISLARRAGVPVLVDPKGSDYARYAGASVLTPNRGELAQVIGRWPDEAALLERTQALRERLGIDAIVLTRSEEGMTLFDADGTLHVRAEAREVFDVTGAGDTVIGVLAALVAAGLPLRDALPHANRAAGIVVGRFGTAAVTYADLFAAKPD